MRLRRDRRSHVRGARRAGTITRHPQADSPETNRRTSGAFWAPRCRCAVTQFVYAIDDDPLSLLARRNRDCSPASSSTPITGGVLLSSVAGGLRPVPLLRWVWDRARFEDRVYASRSINMRCGESCTGPSERQMRPAHKGRISHVPDRVTQSNSRGGFGHIRLARGSELRLLPVIGSPYGRPRRQCRSSSAGRAPHCRRTDAGSIPACGSIIATEERRLCRA